MIFAKTSKAASRLSEEIRSKTFKKEYLVIVNGKMEKEKDTLTDFLWKDEKNNTSYVVKSTKKNAKEAILDYEVIKYDKEKDLSILKINLHTGRHHQIRVQLSSRMHAIYGDNKYHGRGKGTQICLWAYKLTIIHPTTKQKMEFLDLPEKKGMWNLINEKDIEKIKKSI